MRLEKKLNLWESRNLITAGQKQQILEFENSNKKPLFLMGMTLFGIYIMAMGVISLIAANWDVIPGAAKIVLDMALLSAVAYGTFRAGEKNKEIWFEGGIIALFMLCGASIGLIGQVFQTNGSLTAGGIMWSLLTIPLLTISKRKVLPFLWIPLFMVSIGSIEDLWDLLEVVLDWWIWDRYPETGLIILLGIGGILAGFFSMLNYIFKPGFQVFKVALFYAYFLMYGTAIGFMLFGFFENTRIFINIYIILTLFFAGTAFVGDRLGRVRQVNGNIAALYILFLFIYFRVLGSLMMTGIGMIVSGAVIIGSLHFTRKIIRQIKTAKEKNNAKK